MAIVIYLVYFFFMENVWKMKYIRFSKLRKKRIFLKNKCEKSVLWVFCGMMIDKDWDYKLPVRGKPLDQFQERWKHKRQKMTIKL